MNLAVLCLPAAFLAGLAALWLELAWLRSATSALPGTVPAGALVVPALLAAWALGSALAGRLVDRSAARLQLAARWLGLGALAILAGEHVAGLLVGDAPPGGLVARLAVGALPVLPAAALLGGALPLLARVRHERGLSPERATGLVAAAVALGGWAALQLWLPLLDGGRDPARLGALALGAAAGLCWLLERADAGLRARAVGGADEPRSTPRGSSARADGTPGASATSEATHGLLGVATPAEGAAGREVPRALLGLACLLGGVALVSGQLGLLRAQAQLSGDSMAATRDVLGGLHLGMAAGAWLLARPSRDFDALALVGALLALAAFALLGPAAGRDPWITAVVLGGGAGSLVTAASRAPSTAPGRFGRWVGDLAALATLGSVLGGLVTSLVVVPRVGTGVGLHGLAWLLVAVALACALRPLLARRLSVAAARVLPAAAVAVLVWQEPVYAPPWQADAEEVELVAQREGPWGVVSLVRTVDDELRLKLDNRFGLGGSARPLLEERMGRVAAALAPDAERALLLGLGRGHTLAGLARTSRARVDCVERNGEILALDLPSPLGAGEARGGEARVLHADARAWLAGHAGEYDLVVGDLFFPWISGAGELLAAEHFAQVRATLPDDGVYVQWLPLHQIPWPAFGSVAKAFARSFPAARVFVLTSLADVPLVALVGGLLDGLPPGDAVDALLSGAPSAGGPGGMPDLLDLHVCDAWALERRFLDEPVATRARPVSELSGLAHQGDEAWLATTNLRQLADLVEPLEVTSLSQRPAALRESRLLGFELQARGDALAGLLRARAARRELAALPSRDAVSGAQRDRVADLEAELNGSLAGVWSVFPGHLDGRSALLERTKQLTDDERWLDAGGLLTAVLEIQGDGPLGAALGGVFLRLGRPEEALVVLEQARGLAPGDRSVLVNLGSALVQTGRYPEAAEALRAARSAFAPGPLPLLQDTLLGLLEQRPGAADRARELLAALPDDEPWRDTLAGMLGGA